MPRTLSALRKAAEDDALVIDMEPLLDGGDGFKDVHFAGPMPARAIDAAKAIELDLSLVGDRRVAGSTGPQEAINELGLGGIVLPSMQPDVEPGRFGWVVICRQRNAVGQDRAVDFGVVGVDLFDALIPLRLVVLELLGTLDALVQDIEGMVDGSLGSDQVGALEEH